MCPHSEARNRALDALIDSISNADPALVNDLGMSAAMGAVVICPEALDTPHVSAALARGNWPDALLYISCVADSLGLASTSTPA